VEIVSPLRVRGAHMSVWNSFMIGWRVL